eukprot:768511-Hanusia_phi.AAC.3
MSSSKDQGDPREVELERVPLSTLCKPADSPSDMKLSMSPIAQSSANGIASAKSVRSVGGTENGEFRQQLFPDLLTAPGDFCTKIGGLLESSHISNKKEEQSPAKVTTSKDTRVLAVEEGTGQQARRVAEAVEENKMVEAKHDEVKGHGGNVRLGHKTPLSEATSAIEKLGDMISKSIAEQDKKERQNTQDGDDSMLQKRGSLVHEATVKEDGKLLPSHLYSKNPNAIDPVKSASGVLLSVGDYLMKKSPDDDEKPSNPSPAPALAPVSARREPESLEKPSAIGKDLTNTLMLVLDPSLHARSSQACRCWHECKWS